MQGTTALQNNAAYSGEPVTGDWVIMNLLDEPESLNPQTSTSASATNIDSYIYEALIQTRREPPWDEVPLLADGMPEISPDHITYKWKLRPQARWHDGAPLTMRDVEFSLKSLMNPYVDDLPSKPYYAELDSLRVIDDQTLIMHCSKPYFMHLQFLGGFAVIPKHIFDADGLMDGLSYFQVRYGGGYGRLADFLEAKPDVEWNDMVPGAALAALQKGIESATEGKVKWEEVEKGMSPLPERYQAVLIYLQSRPEAAPAVRLLQETYRTTTLALGALPFAAPAQAALGTRHSALLDTVAHLCREMHTRIQRYGERFNAHPQNRAPTVGSGPYRFDHWTTGQEIVLLRDEDYWLGAGYAWLDKIVFRVLTDYTASLVALKNGEIDFMENLQTIQYLTMTNRQGFLDSFVKSTYLIPTYSYIGWRNTQPLFSDKRVRKAMTYMVRRQEIAQKIQFGFSEVIEGPFYRYGADYDSTLKTIPFDPSEAQRLLAEAGWKDTDNDGILEKDTLEFRFELLIPSGIPLAEQVASVMREDLYMIGIEMNVRRLEWSVYINNYIRNKSFDACYLGWAMGLRQDPKQIWHSESARGRGSNHVMFMNPAADSIIDAARVEFDPEKRRELYRRFQQIIYDEQPYTFMFSTKMKPAYSKRFKGVKWYPFRPGYQLDEWFVPKEEQKHR